MKTSLFLKVFFSFLYMIIVHHYASALVPTLLNASYDPTRDFYKEFNQIFIKYWAQEKGETIKIRMSHGGSGDQARAVMGGLKASVVTLALAHDINNLAKTTHKLPEDWQKRLPFNSCPYTSTIVFIVRKGNPKNVKDWGDLVKEDIKNVTPNPKTSGGARWTYLAAWAYASQKFQDDEQKIQEFMQKLYQNTPVLDTAARGSVMTFARRGMGDVLLTWENEAFLLLKRMSEEGFEIINPSISILAEPPVALIDSNVDAKGLREPAEAYLKYLFSKEGQSIAAKHFYRPQKPEFVSKEDLERFKEIKMVTIEEAFGGWEKAQKKHFSNGGIFDQIYKPPK